jgi:hypothetical protein
MGQAPVGALARSVLTAGLLSPISLLLCPMLSTVPMHQIELLPALSTPQPFPDPGETEVRHPTPGDGPL